MRYTFSLKTKGGNDTIDITEKVRGLINGSKTENGLCNVFAPHSTCGITTIEYEPGLVEDLKSALEVIAPMGKKYAHDAKWGDGNGYAHIRSALVGTSVSVPIENGALILGAWQHITFIDFDNRPRERTVHVSIISS